MDKFTSLLLIALIAIFIGLVVKHKSLNDNYEELMKEAETIRGEYIRYQLLSNEYKQEIIDQGKEIDYIEKLSKQTKVRYETRINYIDSLSPVIADSLLARALDSLASTRFAQQDSVKGY